jgi:hypothetical protein
MNDLFNIDGFEGELLRIQSDYITKVVADIENEIKITERSLKKIKPNSLEQSNIGSHMGYIGGLKMALEIMKENMEENE